MDYDEIIQKRVRRIARDHGCSVAEAVPVCAYRGAGRPEAACLIERLVDAAARELNLTQDKIRRIKSHSGTY